MFILGYFNETQVSDYRGPVYFSMMNLTFYVLIGFNVFVIVLALFFWGINCNREKLLLSYWVKEELGGESQGVERTPGQM